MTYDSRITGDDKCAAVHVCNFGHIEYSASQIGFGINHSQKFIFEVYGKK